MLSKAQAKATTSDKHKAAKLHNAVVFTALLWYASITDEVGVPADTAPHAILKLHMTVWKKKNDGDMPIDSYCLLERQHGMAVLVHA